MSEMNNPMITLNKVEVMMDRVPLFLALSQLTFRCLVAMLDVKTLTEWEKQTSRVCNLFDEVFLRYSERQLISIK
jgi:hypothetical protein